jgi:ankyrin
MCWQVLDGKVQYVEMGGNMVPVTKPGEQLTLSFYAFHENRLPFTVRMKDTNQDFIGRIAFMKDPKVARGEAAQTPICTLNLVLPGVAGVSDRSNTSVSH